MHHLVSLVNVSQCPSARSHPFVQTKVPIKIQATSGVWSGQQRRAFVQVSSSLTLDPVITDARELKMINENRDWKTTDRLLNQCLFPTALPNRVIKLLHTIQCYLLLWARLYNFLFAWNSLLFSVNWVFISFAHYPWIADIFAFPSLTYFTCVLGLEFRYTSDFIFSGWLPSCPNIIYKIAHLLISFKCCLFFSFGHAP